ncbi:unnamed protein product [Psylliodes chrysocephalus]|uniref:Uncharacterized protein n=1 Tax=Psylliodes chrysocephalus TaxID=3402493 RepID=A0A9P0CZF5_9CUCU|nr:unnamed protein product [Psylliodes chrysocephala]
MIEICNGYVRYIQRAFGNRVFVVFVGYDQITTKSSERNRRCMHKNSDTVRMAPDSSTVMTLPASVTQDKFLGNSKNKSQLIKFLQEELKRANIMSEQSLADADVDIVLKAIESTSESYSNKVVIVSEDTDVLTMLAARTPPNLEVFLLMPPSARVPDVVYSSKILASRSSCLRSHIISICFHRMRHNLSIFLSRESNIRRFV